MIIGKDLLSKLGMDILYSKCHVEWDHKTVPFKPGDANANTDFYKSDPVAVTDATNRIQQILNAKYKKANLDDIVEQCTHLMEYQQRQLSNLLHEHESLFDGTLG